MVQIKTFGSWMMVACLIGAIGCSSSTQAPTAASGEGSDTAAEARALIDLTANAYQTASAYRDKGYVRLAYSLAGEPFEDRAPLAVSFQAPNLLSIDAYAVQLSSDGKRLQATIEDPQTNHFDGQCLSVPVSDRLTLEEVYADPMVAQFAGSGMGGPAPQLELLLSDNPLAAWLQAPAELALGERQSVDGHACQSVVIDAEPLRYVLWIDAEDYLIRRLELPWQAIAPGLANDPQLTDASLTIELAGAEFERRLPAKVFALQTPPMSVQVTTLINPPPAAPHALVGSRVSSFRLPESTGRFDVNESGSGRPATVLMWIANHGSSQQAAVALQQAIDALPQEVQQRIHPAVVMAEPQSSADTGRMLRSWGVGMPWIDDTLAVGRDVFQITEAPCLVVMGADGSVELHQQRLNDALLQVLPAILTEVADRQPVGRRAREQYIASQASYRRLLSQRSGLQFPLSTESNLLTAKIRSNQNLR
ncbi:hypothetical protein EC9_20750 [Rosistilla ulvae]|uniref:Uncharacterized protein n=1 Tax=Rosistilla ulvae TaxID=1930277 RepID=A0A517LZ48_9BACT|nr:hypothetical protein [Rosistilla ulvae]QDS87892.1 hypothetical protein EC9_20750 [Rosistilla ulvae]